MVTQLHIHVHILFSHIIMLHHKWLDIVPRATQQDLIANVFLILKNKKFIIFDFFSGFGGKENILYSMVYSIAWLMQG